MAFTTDIDKYARKLLYIYTPIVGKRLGRALAEIQKSARNNEYEIVDGVCKIAGYELQPNEFEIKVEVLGNFKGKSISDNSAVVLLDTTITPELKTEGIVRDFIRAIQEERKNKDFNISDRINVYYSSNTPEIIDGIKKFEGDISSTVLAISMEKRNETLSNKLEDCDLSFEIEKA